MKKSTYLLRGIVAMVTLGTLFPVAPGAAQAPPATGGSAKSTLIVTFDKLRSNKGVLHVLLFAQDKGYPDKSDQAFKSRDLTLSQFMGAGADQVSITFADLPPGTYALAAYHDENSNNKMDKHWYGKPKEGVAASNNPRPKARSVRFNEAKFEMGSVGKAIPINVWYP